MRVAAAQAELADVVTRRSRMYGGPMSLKDIIRPLIPMPVLKIRQNILEARSLFHAIKPLHPRTCPICAYKGYFKPFGHPPRLDARCPSCGSLERHRLFWLWLEGSKSKISAPILHFAPELLLEKNLREKYEEYSSADLFNKADLKLNIECIDLPSGCYNTVICNHVLEHVNDKLALSEIFRILTNAGSLVASVPIIEGWERTYEDSSITDSHLRTVHFGQCDHVRYYGRDFRERLKEAGFNDVAEITAEGEQVLRYGLLRGEKLFICRKSLEHEAA